MPCLEVVYAMTYQLLVSQLSLGGFDFPTPWVPHEDFFQCTTSYIATLDAYYETYLGAILSESRDLYEQETWEDMTDEEIFNTVVQIVGFYGAWGLAWVHSTYPNYLLGT